MGQTAMRRDENARVVLSGGTGCHVSKLESFKVKEADGEEGSAAADSRCPQVLHVTQMKEKAELAWLVAKEEEDAGSSWWWLR